VRHQPNGIGVVDHLRRPPYLPDIDQAVAGMKVMKGFMIAMMNPFQLRFYAFQDESLLTRGGWRSPGISRISSNHEGFDEGFHEPCRSSWSI
jgi:hypothetical protein